jgi:serine/threonine protein kinase
VTATQSIAQTEDPSAEATEEAPVAAEPELKPDVSPISPDRQKEGTTSFSSRMLKKRRINSGIESQKLKAQKTPETEPEFPAHDASPPEAQGKMAHVKKIWQPAVGEVINAIRLEKLLGEGSSATVWQAWNQNLHIPVAIKILRSDPHSAGFAERFLSEARLIATLNHPNIVRVYDCGDYNGHLFIEEEYIEGASLGQIIRAKGQVSVMAALISMLNVAVGLGHASRRDLVHRDVKPDNIMVSVDGEIKIADFGQAEIIEGTSDPRSKRPLSGSPAYMAPEFLTTEKTPGMQADIYALGITFYQILVGALPFRGQTAMETLKMHVQAPIPKISRLAPRAEILDDMVARMMAKNPDERYDDYRTLISDLFAKLTEFGQNTDLIQSSWGDTLTSDELGEAAKEVAK